MSQVSSGSRVANALVEEAGASDTPASRLEAIYQELTQRRLHTYPAAPTRAVEIALAGNPNTSPALLQELIEDHVDAVIGNPAFVLALFAEPGFFTEVSHDAIKELLRRSELPALCIQALATHDDEEVRQTAEWHVCLRGEIGNDWPRKVEAVQEKLCYIVASEPLRELALLELAPDTVKQAVEETALREGRKPYLTDLLALASAGREATTVLPESSAGERGARPGSQPPRDAALLIQWLLSGPGGAEAAAGSPAQTLREVLLHHDPHPWQVEARRHIAEDPGQSAEVLTILAEHYLPTVRGRVAGNPTTPESILGLFVSQKDFPILERLANNPRISPEIQIALAETDRWSLHAELLQNPNLQPAVLVNLAAGGSAQTLAGIACHARCPFELLLQLAGDSQRMVRRHVAAVAGLTGEVLERMIPAALTDAARDEDPFCRWIALSHPRIPKDGLEAGARSREWTDRLAVAINPAVPVDLRVLLLNDGHSLIRAAARGAGA